MIWGKPPDELFARRIAQTTVDFFGFYSSFARYSNKLPRFLQQEYYAEDQ